MTPPVGDPATRFWTYVEKTETCWLWRGTVIATGYGHFHIRRYRVRAHRFAYTLLVGEIPDGMFIDHTCHVRNCVNPDHLRLATPKQNSENRAGAQPGNSTGIRGVAWVEARGKWQVIVRHNDRSYWGGYHTDVESAEQAAIALRLRLFTHNILDRQAS